MISSGSTRPPPGCPQADEFPQPLIAVIAAYAANVSKNIRSHPPPAPKFRPPFHASSTGNPPQEIFGAKFLGHTQPDIPNACKPVLT